MPNPDGAGPGNPGLPVQGEVPPKEWLEKLREIGLVIDKEGHFLHEGEAVSHPGLVQALFRWLDRLPPPDGRYVLRWDPPRYAYVTVEDTPLVVRGVRWGPDRASVFLTLSDGSEPPLEPATLLLRPDGSLICRVREGRLEARFSTAALAGLGDALEQDERGAYLRLGGTRHGLGNV